VAELNKKINARKVRFIHLYLWQSECRKANSSARHPTGRSAPSTGNCLEAERIGIPIFVLTPRSVVLVTVDGKARYLWRDDGAAVPALHILALR